MLYFFRMPNTTLFISGKNWQLSLAELASYLKVRDLSFKIMFFSKEFFAVSVEKNIASSSMEDMGGILKMGEAIASFSTDIVKDAFLKRSKEAQIQIKNFLVSSDLVDAIVERASERVIFGVSVYCAEKQLRPISKGVQRFVGSIIKSELASYGKKARFMGFSKERKLAQLSNVEVIKKNMVENRSEILLCIGNNDTWIATTVGVHNPFEFQKRDVYKPKQRKIFAMPPRLARIMVNLSACTAGKILLDPFCGVGTVLQEALLTKAKVVGLDINVWCVKAAEENLEWLSREYGLEAADFRVLHGDVARLVGKIGQEIVDCIVTEPDLGPALRQIPTGPYAQKIIDKLEPLFFGFIEEAYKVLRSGGRLVLVTPYIRTRSGNAVTMPISEKFEQSEFVRVSPFLKNMFSENLQDQDLLKLKSLIDMDVSQKVGREIHIYEK
jgi:tRNA G10  N-methylase Trm11